MNLEELRAFLRVVDEGSFLSAATTLGVSRTTLRRQVDALEARAGVKLLDRNSKGIVLTDAGKRLVHGGRVMEDEFGALLHAIRENDRRPTGEVRIHLPVGLPPMAMAMVYGLLRANWSGVHVRASFSDSPPQAKLSDVDLVVWFGDVAPPGAWEVRTVLQTRQRLFASEAYLAAHGTPTKLAELAAHELLAWLAPGESEARLVTVRGRTRAITAAMETRNVHLLHECAHLGLGLAWAPDGGLPPTPDRPALIPVLANEVGRDVPLRLGVRRVVAEVPRMRLFLDNFERMRAIVLGGS